MKRKVALCLLIFSTSFLAARVKIAYGVSTHQNKRPYQEDRFTHADIYYSGFFMGDFFGVYDGHGGSHVSHFLAQNLHTYFADRMNLPIDLLWSDIFFRAEFAAENSWPDEGSTALAVFIGKSNHLDCAWVGDTRVVLEGNGKVVYATQDHKPDRKDERERIELAGGKIVKQGVWRVNGLAVSRSIGDKTCKMLGVGQIISKPEHVERLLTPENHFLIMASDGLWDAISNEEAVTMVTQGLQDKKSLNDIAQMLQDKAVAKGSKDNITVCVVKFDWQGSFFKRWWNWLWGK